MHRDELPIPAPCNEEWEAMAGGERERFCERCQHAVHDLSSMTKRQARRLLVQQPRDLCVSYLTNERGEIQFRAEPTSRSLRGVALGVALGVAACSRTTGELPPAERTMGAPALAGSGSGATPIAAPSASSEADCDLPAPLTSAPASVPSHISAPPLHRTAGKPMPRKSDTKDPLF